MSLGLSVAIDVLINTGVTKRNQPTRSLKIRPLPRGCEAANYVGLSMKR
jgi:hypothetical protein